MDIPKEDQFTQAASLDTPGGVRDYLHTDELDALGAKLLEECEEFEHILNLEPRLCFVWKRKGGRSGGQMNFSNPVKCSGLVKYLGNYDFIIWVGADHARDLSFEDTQIEAALFRAMKRLQLNGADDADSLCVVAHEFSGSMDEIERYGPWFEALKQMQQRAAQMSLFDKPTGQRRPSQKKKATRKGKENKTANATEEEVAESIPDDDDTARPALFGMPSRERSADQTATG